MRINRSAETFSLSGLREWIEAVRAAQYDTDWLAAIDYAAHRARKRHQEQMLERMLAYARSRECRRSPPVGCSSGPQSRDEPSLAPP